jgi:hypothetical protein
MESERNIVLSSYGNLKESDYLLYQGADRRKYQNGY